MLFFFAYLWYEHDETFPVLASSQLCGSADFSDKHDVNSMYLFNIVFGRGLNSSFVFLGVQNLQQTQIIG